MDNEVENEINAILIEAISNDIQHSIKKSQQAAATTGNSDDKTNDQQPSDVPRCSVCCSQKPRYKCPACGMRTCSLECVKQHKIETNCSGKRDATEKVQKKMMGDRMLLSDYRFLEDANRKIYGIQREYEMNFRPYPKGSRQYLHQQSMNKGFVLWNLPEGMAKREENTTVIGTVKGINNKNKKPMKLFQFHIKWTLDLSSGKTVVIDTKILETWNIGKLSEKIISGLEDSKDEFERSDVKAEVMENNDEPVTLDSDDTGVISGSSVEPPCGESPEDSEILEMGKPIERGKEKYVFNVLMRRVCGPEKYYLFDNAKSLRENLEGKAIIEYPELVICSPTRLNYYHENLTSEIDYRKGKKPQKPGLNASSNVGSAETMNESQNGTNKAWKQRVNMDGVELEPWQKALLNPQKKKKENRKRNKNDRTDAKKQKIDPVHQLLIDGLPPPEPIPAKPSQTARKPESVAPISSKRLPSSLSVQPTQQPTQMLRSAPITNSNAIQKKDNSNGTVLNQIERSQEPITSKKPALKDMMKMFDFDCSDSDSE